MYNNNKFTQMFIKEKVHIFISQKVKPNNQKQKEAVKKWKEEEKMN